MALGRLLFVMSVVWIITVACSTSGGYPPSETALVEQAVIVRLGRSAAPGVGSAPNALADLEVSLAGVIEADGLGEFDGHDLGPGDGMATLYMYGPDAERLFAGIEATLRSSSLTRDARVEIRRGGPGSPSREFRL